MGDFCGDVLLEVSKGTIIGQDSLSFLCCKYRAKTIFSNICLSGYNQPQYFKERELRYS